MANPGKSHWDAVKWVLRYLKGIVSYGLCFKRSEREGNHLVGYCDSDFSGDLDKRKSLIGYCFTLFENIVSWKSVLQSVVALSTTKAEFMALTEATKEALWLKGLAEELGIEQATIPIYCDSQSAIHLTKNQGFHERTKHIDIRLHFIRDIVASKKVVILKIPTNENPADFLTKSVSLIKFHKCSSLIGFSDLDLG